MDIKALALKKHYSGSALVTNVSSMGVEDCFAPHVNFMNTNILMVICTPHDEVVVEDDKPVNKRMMNLNLTFDTRMCTSDEIAKAIETVKEVWNNPEKYL